MIQDNSVKVLLFGRLKEICGQSVIEMNANDTDELRQQLWSDYPGLASQTMAMAVNRRLVAANEPLKPGDEVALMPPYSGG